MSGYGFQIVRGCCGKSMPQDHNLRGVALQNKLFDGMLHDCVASNPMKSPNLGRDGLALVDLCDSVPVWGGQPVSPWGWCAGFEFRGSEMRIWAKAKTPSADLATFGANGEFWPRTAVLDHLKGRFGGVDHLGDDGVFSLYGITDRDLRFVVALVGAAPGSEALTEIGFIARFTGYPIAQSALEAVNRNLHISVASLDGSGEAYLIGGVQASGAFDPTSFGLILDAWRRDLMVVVQALTGAPLEQAYPIARHEAVRRFATNAAPAVPRDYADPAVRSDNTPADNTPADGTPEPFAAFLAAFAGPAATTMRACGDCGGRGKTGLIARVCKPCDGSGFITARR